MTRTKRFFYNDKVYYAYEVYSPDDNGYYLEVFKVIDRQIKDVFSTDVHNTIQEAYKDARSRLRGLENTV